MCSRVLGLWLDICYGPLVAKWQARSLKHHYEFRILFGWARES